MAPEINPAIELLVSQIEDLERRANAYRASVNVLCENDGLEPRYPGGGDGGGGNGSSTSREPYGPPPPRSSQQNYVIKPDAFYGKAQQTAVREFLGFRKLAGAGPAKPSEILDGLRLGGYQVEAKTDEIALVGLRAMLRKRTEVFHKLPNGTWGLREWYPNAKPHKETAGDKAEAGKAAGADESTKSEEADAEASAA